MSMTRTDYSDQGPYFYNLEGQKWSLSMYDIMSSSVLGFNRMGLTDAGYKAATRFYSELSNININLAQVFAERQQTINLVANTASRLANAYRSFRRGRNPFTGTASSGSASSAWLEYTYGWTPLVSDVYAAMNIASIAPPPIKVRASARESVKVPLVPFREPLNFWNEFVVDYLYEETYDERVTVKAHVHVSDPSVVFASQLGLTNPALLAWELLPYSFVVDWFIPVGNWLQLQQSQLGLSLTATSTTRTLRRVGSFECSKTNIGSSGGGYLLGHEHGRFFQKRKERSLDLPAIPLPRPKNPLSVSHALSALALLRQSFGR